jgi:PAS domain S-box-containing protein
MNRKPSEIIGEGNRELENLLSTTINSLSVWIHVVDSDLQIIMMNDALKGMMKSLGFRENLNKKNIREVFPFLSRKVINEYHKVFKTGLSIVTEDMNEFEGRKIYTETIKEPVFEDDKVVRVITVIRDISNRKLTEEHILDSQKQLKTFAAHLQTIREDERVVISRELHDNLGQILTALRIDLSRLIKKLNEKDKEQDIRSLADHAAELMPLIDSSIQMTRKISRELRPRILDELGLVAAIEWQIGEFIKRTGISCTFHSDVQKIEIEVRNKIAVFRIIQEALTNIVRHAQATRVAISIRKKNQSIIIEVKDYGSGISDNDISGANSLGLTGMRERAVLLGGTLMIKGKSGKGTTVRLSIPLKAVRKLK